jgi:mRNA-degrading endonuclease RelE of RelBE toxin-antitoxin system
MKTISYSQSSEFQKDLKALKKRFRSLENDIKVAKKHAIEGFHLEGIDNRSIFELSGFPDQDIKIHKIKKFACKSLKGRGNKSGIRIIYAYLPKKHQIKFIELYFKGDKANEDRARIKEYLKTQQP